LVGWGATALGGFPDLKQVAVEALGNPTKPGIFGVGFRPSIQPTATPRFIKPTNIKVSDFYLMRVIENG